jgi:CDP-diacylglycerol--glycerol-3-phosphate 3-phosphatidyltransferase
MAMAVLWTVLSGVDYLWKAWPLLRKGWAPHPATSTEVSVSETSR